MTPAERAARERRERVDVVVIGAGVAGLEAARALAGAGWRVAVLEARDRVGGRIDTRAEPDWPVPIDLGAEFVHGRSPLLLDRLHAAGIDVVTLKPAQHRAEGGRLVPATREWKRALALAGNLPAPRAGADPTVATQLSRAAWRRQGSADERRLARAYLEGFNAADLRRASVRALVAQQEAAETIGGDALGRPSGGYRALPLHLAEQLAAAVRRRRGDRAPAGGPPALRLGTVVDRIVWTPGSVRIEARAADGVPLRPIEARLAIVTVPLGVLQAPAGAPGAIRFEPALPAGVRTAIGALAMGTVTKAVVRFNRTPWRRPPSGELGFLHVPGGAFPTLWTLAEGERPVLVAWAAGPAADRLRGRTPAQLRRTALGTLAQAFQRALGDLESFVDGVIVAVWGDDPFARGAYSWVPVGGADAATRLAKPVADTLVFAGEATEASGHAGTVHGALMTGARAAAQARSILGWRAATVRDGKANSR